MPIIVTMRWIESKQQWLMTTKHGIAIQEFFNCARIRRTFPGLDKSKPTMYQITVKMIGGFKCAA